MAEQVMQWADLSPREQEIIDELMDGSEHSARELADLAKMSIAQVSTTIRNIRKKHREGKDTPYIYRSQFGYTLEEEPFYESKMRLQTGYGTLINGIPVFKMCKKIRLKEFRQMNIEFKPQALTVQKLIQGKE